MPPGPTPASSRPIPVSSCWPAPAPPAARAAPPAPPGGPNAGGARGGVGGGGERRHGGERRRGMDRRGGAEAAGGAPFALSDAAWAAIDARAVAPVVRPERPLLAAARRRGLPVLAEVELAFPFLNGPVVAVTGTNGKS